VMTPLTAITTPDTVLAPGWAARSLTDVLRLDSAELSALVWACHWPCASLTKVARAVLTLLRSVVSWLTAPVPTLTSLRLSSEVRKAAALAHRSASGDAADAEAVADGVVPLAGVLADEVLPLDPHPAASSARPQVIMASSHRAALFAMRRFISREATRAASERTSPFWDHSWPAAQLALILAAPTTARSSARSIRERTSSLAPHDGADWGRITVHDTRHTCATLLAALDVHPRVAMRIFRHAQIDVTMNVYTDVSDAKTLLKRLGKQLGE
jgi:Phage integrase family